MLYAGCTMGTHMSECIGVLNGKKTVALRDTGCSSVVVRAELVQDAQFTGNTQTVFTHRRAPFGRGPLQKYRCVVRISQVMLKHCVWLTLYNDLGIGNVPGARNPGDVQLSRTGAPENMVVTETAEEEATLHGNYLDDVTWEPGHDEDHSDDSDDDVDWPIQQGASVETRGIRRRKEQPLMRLGSADQPETAATRDEITVTQQADESLEKLRAIAGKGKPKIVGKGNEVNFYFKNGIVFREYRSPAIDHGKTFNQLVVPKPYRSQVLRLAHDSAFAGHLKTRKTTDRILTGASRRCM